MNSSARIEQNSPNFDSVIKSSLCISEFDWLAPNPNPYPPLQEFIKPSDDTDTFLGTVIAIDGNTIGNNFIIDLWSTDHRIQNPIHDKVSKRLHKFEAIGVKTGALVIDFKDSRRNYFTAVDGLDFRRVHNAHATCEYGGNESEVAPILEDRKHTIISDFTEQLQLPSAQDVLDWLNLNESGSTQPYAAFATAFETAGLDSTPIKVERANRELCDRAARWLLPTLIERPCPSATRRAQMGVKSTSMADKDKNDPPIPSNSASGWSEIGGAIDRFAPMLSDFWLFVFRSALWLLADHGYRPGKVFWWVTFALVFFWSVFMILLRVVAFSTKSENSSNPPTSEQQNKTESKPELRPISLFFLLDRLLPAYKITDINYDIDKYYKRIPLSEATNGTQEMTRFMIFHWKVDAVSKKEKDRVENWLLILRLLGVVFTIFLAAAISQLIVH